MRLGELIEALEALPRDREVEAGFARPHSYRGYYYHLAFEPERDTTVGAMLDAARSANAETFTGWKGGDYTMDPAVRVYLAHEGECGEEIGERLLGYMLFSGRSADRNVLRSRQVTEEMVLRAARRFDWARAADNCICGTAEHRDPATNPCDGCRDFARDILHHALTEEVA